MKRIIIALCGLACAVGCQCPNPAYYHTTVESPGWFLSHNPNNVITVGNNTPHEVELNRDGVAIATLAPGDVFTVRIHAHQHAVETTLTAVSKEPAAMDQRVFYLHSTGVQGLNWQIQRLIPQGHGY